MNYPVWYIPVIGGPLIIAFVAIVHVVVSHFAVGGGLWLVLTEKKGINEKKDFIIDYVKKHSKFFLLLTMVFSAITGVGIWFTIALIHPDATSVLIHNFVFGWAMEWVLFLIEIVTAFLYFYTWGKVSNKTHLLIGWIYFAAAWGSLLIINAILTFMLTPGAWIETHNFWDGIFNPSFLPSTLFRTFLCFALAGVYGMLTATKKFKKEERSFLVKYNVKWIFYSLLFMVPALIWHYFAIPGTAQKGIAGSSSIMISSVYHLVISFGLILLLLFVFLLWKTDKFSFTNSIILFVAIFVFFGAFEFLREAGRKPFIIKDYMYSNAIRVDQFEKMKDSSILEHSKWVKNKEVTQDNEIEAGGEIFRVQCYACHSLGIKNNINKKMAQWDLKKIRRIIGNLKGITPFMTGFVGTEDEKTALAKWFYSVTHDGEPVPGAEAIKLSGEKLFENYCSDCHETETDDPAIIKLKEKKTLEEILEMLGKLDTLNEDMPPFEGSEEEKKILAEYLEKLRSKK